jgi:hypothetical protein
MALLLLLLVALLTPQQQTASPRPAPAAQPPLAAPASSALDYQFFKTRVQPIFLKKRPGNARCIVCHETGAPRLQPLPEGQTMWDEEASRKNFDAWSRVVTPGSEKSRLLMHPLAASAGGDPFHAGGKHWTSKSDPEWQTLLAWVNGAKGDGK